MAWTYTAAFVPLFCSFATSMIPQLPMTELLAVRALYVSNFLPLITAYLLLAIPLIPLTVFALKAQRGESVLPSLRNALLVAAVLGVFGVVTSFVANLLFLTSFRTFTAASVCIAGGGLVFTAVYVAAIILHIVNFNKYKPQLIASESAESFGRDTLRKVTLIASTAFLSLMAVYVAAYAPVIFGLFAQVLSRHQAETGYPYLMNGYLIALLITLGYFYVLSFGTLAYNTAKAFGHFRGKDSLRKLCVSTVVAAVCTVISVLVSLTLNTVYLLFLRYSWDIGWTIAGGGYAYTCVAFAVMVLNIINYRSYKAKVSGGKSEEGESLPEGNAVA